MKNKKIMVMVVLLLIVGLIAYFLLEKEPDQNNNGKTSENIVEKKNEDQEAAIEEKKINPIKEELKKEIRRVLYTEEIMINGSMKIEFESKFFGENIPIMVNYNFKKNNKSKSLELETVGSLVVPNKMNEYRMDAKTKIVQDEEMKRVYIKISDLKEDWARYKELSGVYINDLYYEALGMNKKEYEEMLKVADGYMSKKYGRNNDKDEYLMITYDQLSENLGIDPKKWTSIMKEEEDFLKKVLYLMGPTEGVSVINKSVENIIDGLTDEEVNKGEWVIQESQINKMVYDEITKQEKIKSYANKITQNINEEISSEKLKEILDKSLNKQGGQRQYKIKIERNEKDKMINKIIIQENEQIIIEMNINYNYKGEGFKYGKMQTAKNFLKYGDEEKEKIYKEVERFKSGEKVIVEEEEKPQENITNEENQVADNEEQVEQNDPISKVNKFDKSIVWNNREENAAADGNIYVNYQEVIQEVEKTHEMKKQTVKNNEGIEEIINYEYKIIQNGIVKEEYIYEIVWEEGMKVHKYKEILNSIKTKEVIGYYQDGVFKEK